MVRVVLMTRRPPRATLFPYETLVRSTTRVPAPPEKDAPETLAACATPAPSIATLGHGSSVAIAASASPRRTGRDRKSTRLNSSHRQYLVCRLLLQKQRRNGVRP